MSSGDWRGEDGAARFLPLGVDIEALMRRGTITEDGSVQSYGSYGRTVSPTFKQPNGDPYWCDPEPSESDSPPISLTYYPHITLNRPLTSTPGWFAIASSIPCFTVLRNLIDH